MGGARGSASASGRRGRGAGDGRCHAAPVPSIPRLELGARISSRPRLDPNATTSHDILRDGNNPLAFGTLDANGQVTFTFIPGQVVGKGRNRFTILPKGVHHLSVSYTGDGNFAASVSAPLDLTVV